MKSHRIAGCFFVVLCLFAMPAAACEHEVFVDVILKTPEVVCEGGGATVEVTQAFCAVGGCSITSYEWFAIYGQPYIGTGSSFSCSYDFRGEYDIQVTATCAGEVSGYASAKVTVVGIQSVSAGGITSTTNYPGASQTVYVAKGSPGQTITVTAAQTPSEPWPTPPTWTNATATVTPGQATFPIDVVSSTSNGTTVRATCGTSSCAIKIVVVGVGSIENDRNVVCWNDPNGIVFTAVANPNGPLDYLQWEGRRRDDPNEPWSDWGTVDLSVQDPGINDVRLSGTPGYFQLRARNGSDPNSWVESAEVAVVKFVTIQYNDSTNGWTDIPEIMYAHIDSLIEFRAVKEPNTAPWPSGKPVWSDSLGVFGAEEDSASVRFNTLSSDSTDYKTVTVECGYAITANVIVYEIIGIEISDGVGNQPWSIPLKDTDDIIVDISVDPIIGDLCFFPESFVISTSKAGPMNWPIVESNSEIVNNGQIVRVTIPNAEARICGLIIDSMFTLYDRFSYEANDSSNFNDSAMYDFHSVPTCVIARAEGNWTDTTITTEKGVMWPWTARSRSEFLSLGGSIYLDVFIADFTDRGMIQHQADNMYLSGHGLHQSATFSNVSPESLEWTDKNSVIFAACSILDIGDFNNRFPDEDPPANPGLRWASLPIRYLLGYNATSPTDNHHGIPTYTAYIVERYFFHKSQGISEVFAWLHANKDRIVLPGTDHACWNSCVIDTSNQEYWYWHDGIFGHVIECFEY